MQLDLSKVGFEEHRKSLYSHHQFVFMTIRMRMRFVVAMTMASDWIKIVRVASETPRCQRYLRLTDAGLLSISETTARQESAIISLLALDSHSIVSSCSWVCFTSTTPITFNSPVSALRYELRVKPYPQCRDPVSVESIFYLSIHAFKMPPYELPANS